MSTQRRKDATTKHRRRLGVAVASLAIAVSTIGMGVASAAPASALEPAVGFNCGHIIEAHEGAWVRENPDTNSVKLKWKPVDSFLEWHCDWKAVVDTESGVLFQPVICACASDNVGWVPSSAFD
jgi:hypothetical protein